MWFDVNAALKEVLEQRPETPPPTLVQTPEKPSRTSPITPRLTGDPIDIANAILGMLRECETLGQASAIITLHQSEIARIEAIEPARKTHIESYLRHRWSVASSANFGRHTS